VFRIISLTIANSKLDITEEETQIEVQGMENGHVKDR
jgi:hypothetical protein